MSATFSRIFPGLAPGATQTAVQIDDAEVSYADLLEHAIALERLYARERIPAGGRVLVWARPDLKTVKTLVAAMATGQTLVPVSPSIGQTELCHIVKNAAPALALSSRPDLDAARTPVPTLSATLSGPTTSHALYADRVIRADDDPALILFTSGTTGLPKGAMLSERNVRATLDGLQQAWDITPRDTLVHALPLFHAHGLVFGLFGALRAGASLRFVPKFSPREIAGALTERSVLYAVPTMYHRLCDAAEQDPFVRERLAAARLLVSGSAALPEREHRRLESLTGQRPCERYGLTETLINTAIRHDQPRRAGYVGTPLPGVELRLVDDKRQPLASSDDATLGEIAVRGENVFLGYLNHPEATRATLDDAGWFYTGDVGTLSHDGYLRIVGRKTLDLIKTGGFKVGAGEVEAALLEQPEVDEAAVIGLPDEDLGERIVAFVVAKKGAALAADALLEAAAARLAPHKRPREIRFLDALPKNAMGKVQKAALRNGAG